MTAKTAKRGLAATGLFMLSGAYFVLALVFTMTFSNNASAAEGFFYVMAGLFLIGGAITAAGVPSLSNVHSGPFGAAGIFGLLVGLAGTAVLVLPMMSSGRGSLVAFMTGVQILMGVSMLFALFAGLAMFSAKGIPVFKAGGGVAFLGSLGAAFMLALTFGLFGGGIAGFVPLLVVIALGTACLLGGIGALASR